MRRALVLAAATLVLAAGCGHAVDGDARAAATAVEVLPTEDEISGAVGNRLNTYDFRPFVGGAEIMPDGFRTDADATPIACVGVTDTMTKLTYETGDIVKAARQSYFSLAPGTTASGADAAVVRFATPTEASGRFSAFVAQWHACDGKTVVKHVGANGADVVASISRVVDDGGLLTADVTTRQGAAARDVHYARALALRDATIVEVSLALTAKDDGAAARVATLMIDKVG